jgi:uncharacterized membrane protein YtjA (UPF0391 family)
VVAARRQSSAALRRERRWPWTPDEAPALAPTRNFAGAATLQGIVFKGNHVMFKWAVICLVISLIAGGLGLTNISALAKKVAMILFALFLPGFLALLGFAYVVGSAIAQVDVVPALVAVSV